MMKELLSRVLVFIFACAIAVAVSFAHAEESMNSDSSSNSRKTSQTQEKEVLTLKEFLRRVLKNNPDILVKEKELENAKFNERSTWAAFLPQVELTLSKTQTLKKDPTTHEDENGNAVQDPPGPSFLESLGTYKSELEVKQSLFNGFIDVSHVRATQLKYRQAQFALKETQSRVLRDAVLTYTRLLAFIKYKQLAELNKKRRQDNLDIVKIHYMHGQEDQGSVLLCQANLELAEARVLNYQRQLVKNQEELLELMGDLQPEQTQVDSTVNIQLEKEPEPLSYQSMIEAREEYINAVYEEEFAHDDVRTAQAGFLPKLDLTATGTNESSLDFGRQQQWEMKLELKIPLFQGGKDYYSLQSSRNNWLIAKTNKESIYKSTYKALRDAYYKYEEAVTTYFINETIVKARRIKSAVVREKYRAGLTKFDSWDASEIFLYSEESDYIESYRDALIAQVQWWHLSGKGFDHLWK